VYDLRRRERALDRGEEGLGRNLYSNTKRGGIDIWKKKKLITSPNHSRHMRAQRYAEEPK